MKNTKTGKLITRIFTVLACLLVIAMTVCYFFPYFTITKEANKYLDPNPQPVDYTLIDLLWTNTKVINEHFSKIYGNFDINNYVTYMVLSFVFGLATVVTSVWHTYNEIKRYPDMTSGVLTNIACVGWGVFSLLAYLQNDLLALGTPAFMGIRPVFTIFAIVATVVAVIRFVIWLLTEIQIAKDRKARLALL